MILQNCDHGENVTGCMAILGRGSVAEWQARRTRYPAVPGSSPALASCWICPWSFRVPILAIGHACKWLTGCLLRIEIFNPVMFYLNYLFLSI